MGFKQHGSCIGNQSSSMEENECFVFGHISCVALASCSSCSPAGMKNLGRLSLMLCLQSVLYKAAVASTSLQCCVQVCSVSYKYAVLYTSLQCASTCTESVRFEVHAVSESLRKRAHRLLACLLQKPILDIASAPICPEKLVQRFLQTLLQLTHVLCTPA
jgi:hypothetical protein